MNEISGFSVVICIVLTISVESLCKISDQYHYSPTVKNYTNYRLNDNNYYGYIQDPFLNLSKCQVDELKQAYLKNLTLSEHQINILESSTRRQSKCQKWIIERQKRLTASIFGKICKMHKTTSPIEISKEIIFSAFEGNAATRYGVIFEKTAIEQLEKELEQIIKPSGLIVDVEIPFFAASPDGVVNRNSLVEIKCPSNSKELTPEKAITSGKITYCSINKKKLQLKRSHNYYYQVQGQLHISRRMYCYFCIWTPKGLMYEKIKRDDEFWKNRMEKKLKNFYLEHLLPKLIKRKLNKNYFIKYLICVFILHLY